MDQWCPFAERRDGRAGKVGYPAFGNAGPKRGEVKHSAEGYWPGIYQVLDGTRRASWHFTVGYDRIEQHYRLTAHCWHAGDVDDDGGVAANLELVGIEHLGLAGETLTDYQVDATVRLTKWCADQFMRDRYALYPEQHRVWTMAEHNQVSNVHTACPSGRIPWLRIMRMLEREEDEMPDGNPWPLEETRAQWAAVAALFTEAAAYAAQGLALPKDVRRKLEFLLAA